MKAITCRKCAYERTELDTGPDWRCPNCGVAYDKVGTQPEARANSAAAAAVIPQTGPVVVRPAEVRENTWILLVAVQAVIGCAIAGYLAWALVQARSDPMKEIVAMDGLLLVPLIAFAAAIVLRRWFTFRYRSHSSETGELLPLDKLPVLPVSLVATFCFYYLFLRTWHLSDLEDFRVAFF